ETTASSLGAELVAEAIATEAKYRNLDVQIVRNGSRGACFLEPLVEVDTPQGRVGYGPVTPDDVHELFDSNFLGLSAGHSGAEGSSGLSAGHSGAEGSSGLSAGHSGAEGSSGLSAGHSGAEGSSGL